MEDRFRRRAGKVWDEQELLFGPDDMYGIYQLKDGEAQEGLRFVGKRFLDTHNLSVEKENYELVYTGKLEPGIMLDDLYQK